MCASNKIILFCHHNEFSRHTSKIHQTKNTVMDAAKKGKLKLLYIRLYMQAIRNDFLNVAVRHSGRKKGF